MRRSNFPRFFSESMKNFVRHPLVTVASITTVALMLFIVGAFFVFSLDARHILDQASQKPPVEIYAKNDVTDEQLNDIEQKLEASPWVANYKKMSPQENYEEFKDYLGEDSYVLDDFSADLLPYTFVVNLLDPDMIDNFLIDFRPLNGVREVKYSGSVMSFFSNARNYVNIISLVSFIVLGVIALFIISNMVRLSALARSQEIQIMKYVGATNHYIRIPYILEGGFVGLLGAILATLCVHFAYETVYNKVNFGDVGRAAFSLLPPTTVLWPVLGINVLLGILIGALGSGISVRKYVQV